MIIILNGSIAVGKTTISWELSKKLKNSVMLDGDYLGAVNPFKIYDPERICNLYSILEYLVKFYITKGYSNIIINYIFETPNQLSELTNRLRLINTNINAYWLTCSVEEQESRIKSRKRFQYEMELDRFRKLNTIMIKSNSTGYIGKHVNISSLSTSEIVERLLLLSLTSNVTDY